MQAAAMTITTALLSAVLAGSSVSAWADGSQSDAEQGSLNTTQPDVIAPGTRIYGESEQAAGLYLVPWENSQASDVDRPPSLLDAPLTELDVAEFERYAQWIEAEKAYRLWRLHRNNW